MASSVPKPASIRQRRNRVAGAMSIEAPVAQKLALSSIETGDTWHPLTLQTWDVWWASPIAEEWVDADVPGLIELARLVNDFWRAADARTRKDLRAEIRMSSREYGLSSFSRRQLQWEVKRLETQAPPAPPAPRRSRRAVFSVLAGGHSA